MEHVVLFKRPPLRRWPVINEWARKSGSHDSWLGKEGIRSKGEGREKRWRCAWRGVCVRHRGKTKRDIEMESLKGEIKSQCKSLSARKRKGQAWGTVGQLVWDNTVTTSEDLLLFFLVLIALLFLGCVKSPCSPAEIWLLLPVAALKVY